MVSTCTLIRALVASAYLGLSLCAGIAHADDSEIAVSVDKRDNVFYIDTAFDVAVPVRIAWGVLTDFDHMTEILHNLTSSKITERSGKTLRVKQEGIARFGFFTYAFKSDREVQLEPMKRISVRQISGNTKHYTSEMNVSPNGSGTHFRYHAEMALDSGIGRFFAGPFIEHEIAEQFASMTLEMQKRHQAQ